MDKLAPVKIVSDKPKLQWFNDNLACKIRKRKWLEKIWHKDRTSFNKYHWFYTQHCKVSIMLSFAEDFYKTSLNENKYNYKKIFGICNHLLGRNQDLLLPIHTSFKELAGDFNTSCHWQNTENQNGSKLPKDPMRTHRHTSNTTRDVWPARQYSNETI